MAAKDPRKELSNYVGETPETLVANTLLIPFGHGVRSLRDLTIPSADIELDPRMAGFSKEQANRIKSARTPEEFEAITREEFLRATRKNGASAAAPSIRSAPTGSGLLGAAENSRQYTYEQAEETLRGGMPTRETTGFQGDHAGNQSTKKETRAAAPAFNALGIHIVSGRPKIRVVPLS